MYVQRRRTPFFRQEVILAQLIEHRDTPYRRSDVCCDKLHLPPLGTTKLHKESQFAKLLCKFSTALRHILYIVGFIYL